MKAFKRTIENKTQLETLYAEQFTTKRVSLLPGSSICTHKFQKINKKYIKKIFRIKLLGK